MYRFLKRSAKHENDENERNADQNDPPFGDGTRHAKTRGQPDTGCGGQSMDVLTFVADDNTHAQKPNSGQDALNDAADVGAAGRADGEDGERRPDPDDAERANARRLAVKIAVEAQRGASHVTRLPAKTSAPHSIMSRLDSR